MSSRVRLAAVAALFALAGCGRDESATGIVVEVTSDLAPSADLQFFLGVFGADGMRLREIPFGSGDLPARLSLVPTAPDQAGQITVVATALVGTPPLSRKATLGFKRGAMVLLRLPLNADCACVSCTAGMTCEAGSCVDSLKDPATLPAWTPGGHAPPGTAVVPVCRSDGGPAMGEAGVEAGASAPGDARIDTATFEVPPVVAGADATVGPDLGVAPLDAGPDAPASGGPDLPPAGPDTSVLAPDAAVPPPDAPVLAPDASLPPDTGGRPAGAACSAGDQCLSTACVDGVCCASSCTAPCMGCSNLKTGAASGQCAPISAGTDPDGDCAADAPSSCLYDGLCDGAGACRLYGSTTLCAAATCTSSTFTPARMCTGAGGCMPPAPQSCDQFLCTPSGCPATCQSHANCINTAYCDGVCKAKKPALQPCAAGYECLSGTCTIGLVCL